jgi:hypothetical protein
MTPAGGSLLKDRTSDFQAMTQRLMRQLHIAGGPHQHPCPVHQQSEFTRQALQIGGSISKTSTQLQRLVQLSKQTTMFHDPATEIESLTGIIKQVRRMYVAPFRAAGCSATLHHPWCSSSSVPAW